MSQYAAAKGVGAAETAVPASGAMILAGGLSVIAGVRPRQGLALIIGFLVPVSLQMHRFWEIEEPTQRMSEMINFTKNMALVGAALMMMELPEPWPGSVDGQLELKRIAQEWERRRLAWSEAAIGALPA